MAPSYGRRASPFIIGFGRFAPKTLPALSWMTSILSKGYREYVYSKAKGRRSQEKEYENPPYDDVPRETHKIQVIKIK
jgi:hypothetical protein